MDATGSSEMSVDFESTKRRYIPESVRFIITNSIAGAKMVNKYGLLITDFIKYFKNS
jgi:hypothetical protein